MLLLEQLNTQMHKSETVILLDATDNKINSDLIKETIKFLEKTMGKKHLNIGLIEFAGMATKVQATNTEKTSRTTSNENAFIQPTKQSE